MRKDRSMVQVGEMGTERDMGQRRLDGIGQKQIEKHRQRVRGEQSEADKRRGLRAEEMD